MLGVRASIFVSSGQLVFGTHAYSAAGAGLSSTKQVCPAWHGSSTVVLVWLLFWNDWGSLVVLTIYFSDLVV